jgi:transcriptional regulator with XRE-family HTH domain
MVAESRGMMATDNRVGTLLRGWRQRRRLSQLDLALEAGVSTRHLSFVETGRSRPSVEMVLHLADQLEVPLRERNQLLLAAGYAPRYESRSLEEDPGLASVREALHRVLTGHEPYPAFAIDGGWNLVMSNTALDPLLEGVAPELLVPPVNVMRLALHPQGLAPRIVNLGEWRSHLLERLSRQLSATGDPRLEVLLDELREYPGPRLEAAADGHAIMVELHLAASPEGGELRFFSTVTTFGTAADVTVSELSVEAFFPADAQTAERLRG